MSQEEFYTVASNPVSIEPGKLNVLFAGESQTAPLHQQGPKVYDFYLMHHVLAGEGKFVSQERTYTVRAGQTFVIEPQQLVSYISDAASPWHYRWVAFAGSEAAQLVESAGLFEGFPVLNEGSRRLAMLFRRIRQVFGSSGEMADMQALGYLHLIIAELGQALLPAHGQALRSSENNGLMQRIVHYLSTQYAEPVSIEQMADTLGYNRAYLSRQFKQRTGMTPVHFLLKLRLDKARQLLRGNRELTIEQVAASVGFHDPLYFSKQFRRMYEQSPTAYRDAMKQVQQPES
ncbi:AraC family transcriptional regulator [Paenibacillus daejeonensis]|uniref:AraC family transcriptional regulator n=1 Tax=Paenibacillus daejeonensis TaxID=135193 RepID=UPI000360FF8E|nr:AraC family transcriptional regulator [Paenibacillus daejeonensis]